MKFSKVTLTLVLVLGIASAQVVKIGVNLPITGPNAPMVKWDGLV